MNKKTLILGALAIFACTTAFTSCQNQTAAGTASQEGVQTSAQKGAIVYFNLDRILNEYDMANDLSSVLQSKLESIDQELTRRGNKLQSDVNSFNDKINKGLLTRSTAEAQSNRLQQQQDEFQTYAAQKQQEMQEEQAVTMNQIADAIKTYIDKYNAEKQYAMIIATQGDILPQPVVAGDPDLDITDELLEGLNAEYIQTKNQK